MNVPERCVHLLLRQQVLARVIDELLCEEGWATRLHTALEELLLAADPDNQDVAVIDWKLMDGLLSDERRQELALLNRRVSVVLLVPNSWRRLARAEDLGVAAVLPSPFEAQELLAVLGAIPEVAAQV